MMHVAATRAPSAVDPERLIPPHPAVTPSEALTRQRAVFARPIPREKVSADQLTIRRCAFCGRQMATACLATLTLRQPATHGAAERVLYLCTGCKEGIERMAQRTVDRVLARCAEHASPSEIALLLTKPEWRDKENASYARGERQIRCGQCGSWFWPWEATAELDLKPLTTDEHFDREGVMPA